MPLKKAGLKRKLAAQNRRLPHGYELVARKKRKPVTKRKAIKRKVTKKRKATRRESGWFG